jgi:hypothetical protein
MYIKNVTSKYLIMKRTISLLILIISCVCAIGQNSQVKELLKSIEGKWSLDDNRNVTYQRIMEVPEMKKDDIYNRVQNFFVYNYGSGKSVIQTQDKEKGQIVGKGLFEDIHTFSNGFGMVTISTWHIVRVDVKDGKARIILTLSEYNEYFNGGGNGVPSTSNSIISQQFPINQNGGTKNNKGKAFYKSHEKAIETLDAIEKAIKEGNTSKEIENDKW